MSINHKRLHELAVDADSDAHTVSMTDGSERRTVSLSDDPECSCSFYQQNMLPCRHMVKCWQDGRLTLQQLVFGRWAKERCNMLQPERTGSIPLAVPLQQPAPTFRRVEAVLGRLSEMIMACGDREARLRLQTVERIVRRWENGLEVTIATEGDEVESVEVDAIERDNTHPIDAALQPQTTSLRALQLRLPRVRSNGNVKRKKTVTFAKTKSSHRSENLPPPVADRLPYLLRADSS